MDPRADRHDICGVEFTGSTGITWICIKKVHAKIYQKKSGGLIFSDNGADRHYFVPKWPNRKKEKNG